MKVCTRVISQCSLKFHTEYDLKYSLLPAVQKLKIGLLILLYGVEIVY